MSTFDQVGQPQDVVVLEPTREEGGREKYYRQYSVKGEGRGTSICYIIFQMPSGVPLKHDTMHSAVTCCEL